MKHILNNISEEEKNAIREQHTGGMKLNTEKFKKLLETKQGDVKPYLNESSAQSLIDSAKKQLSSGLKPDPAVKEQIKECITRNQLKSLMFLTTGAGAYFLGLIAVLLASGAVTAGGGTILGGGILAFTGAVTMIIASLPEDQGGLGSKPGEDIKRLYNCITTARPGVSEQIQDKIPTVSSSSTAPKVIKDKMTSSDTNATIMPCAQLGVKSPGVCETKTKKPVKYCSELGVKSPGFCYVDTKQPVPGLKATPATKSQKTGNSVHMNEELMEQVKTLTVGSKGGAMVNPTGNRPGHFNFVVKKVLGNNKYMVTISKWEFNSGFGKVGDSGTLTVGNKDSKLNINGQDLDGLMLD